MTHRSDIGDETKSGPLVVSRRFPAPRALVFEAWSTAANMKRWFSPEGYTVPEAEIDFRPGGACALCMRSPEGRDFWSRGTFIEVSPPHRLVFTLGVSVDGALKFTAHTTITFEDDGAGTRMTVHQTYDLHEGVCAAAVEGASEGWRTTLDKLGREVARIRALADRSVVHGSFSLERTYDVAPHVVFHALSDQAAKARWFVGGDGYVVLEREMDVRPGGHERLKGRWANGTVSTFEATYYDVVANERLIYAYEMTLDDRKISVSLATVDLKPTRTGTRLVLTEQGAFLDGYDDAGSRERGSGALFDQLGVSLRG